MTRPHQLLFGALFLVLVGVTGTVLLQGVGGVPALLGDGPAIQGATRAQPDTPTPWPDPHQGQASTGAGPERTQAGDTAPEGGGEVPMIAIGGSTVIVRDGPEGAPVAGATIAFQKDVNSRGRFQGIPGRSTRAQVESEGERDTTDAAGRFTLPKVRVPRDDAESFGNRLGWSVLAWHGGKFAAGRVAATGDATLELELVPDETLRVLVVDANGKPLPGVMVEVRRRYVRFRGNDIVQRDGRDRIYTRNTGQMWTDAQGRARLDHWQITRTWDARSLRGFAVRPAILTLEDVSREVPIDRAPPEPIEMRMPPLGSVVVRMRNRQGRLLTSSGSVKLEPGPDSKGAAGRSSVRASNEAGHSGEYLFPFVGLGLQLEINGTTGRARLEQRVIMGPAQPGQEVAVECVLREGHLGLSGRLMTTGDDGEPRPWVGNAAVELEYPTHRPRSSNFRTDGEGRFDVWFRSRDEWPLRASFRPRTPSSQSIAVVPLARRNPTEQVTLGDVLLKDLPPLVNGTVVDDLGQPLAGVRIRTYRRVTRGERLVRQRLRSLDGTTTADGSFRVRGAVEPGTEIQLWFLASGHVRTYSEPLQTPHRGSLNITLPRQSGLQVSAIAMVPFTDDQVQLHLIERAGKSKERSLDFKSGRATYRSSSMAPGTYRVEFRANGVREPLHVVDNVVLGPGARADDPRLRDIPVGVGLSSYRLRLGKTPDGDPPSNAYLVFVGEPEALGLTGRTLRIDRRFRWIHLPLGALDVVLYATGFPPTRLTLAPGEHVLQLPPRRTLTVQLQGNLPDLHGEFGKRSRYRLLLRWLDEPQWAGDLALPSKTRMFRADSHRVTDIRLLTKGGTSRADVDGHGRAEILLPCTGPVRVQLQVVAGRSTSPVVTLSTVEIGPLEPAWLGQEVPQERLQEALVQLRARVATAPRTPKRR